MISSLRLWRSTSLGSPPASEAAHCSSLQDIPHLHTLYILECHVEGLSSVTSFLHILT